jgi:uncharacterized protein (TIGR02391 family)
MIAMMLDNVQILKAIDDRQQRGEGRPLWISAHELFREITGTYLTNEQAAGFLQELNIANAAGLLTWQVRNQTAHPQDANYYLQRIEELALTVAGQDRARNQMVVLPPPEPGEDDGHHLSDLILRQVADAITREYAPDQRVTFLGEQGIPPDWLALPEETAEGDVHAALATTWRAGSEGRRLVRHFLGRWLDDQLITGPDAEQRATLIEQLARQGWQVRMTDSVLVAAEPVRGIPVSAGFLRASRLHPLIESEARPQFLINKPAQGVFASMKAVEIRVRKLAGLGDELIGTDLMNRAFRPGGPLIDPSAVTGEQKGAHFLFAGAMAVLRNPAGHREVDYGDLSEAAEAVQLSSLLMRILDREEDRLVAAGRAAQAGTHASGSP